MACEDCLKKCGGIMVGDKCVEYTGANYDTLGICTGDSLFEVETIILDKLLTLMDGTGITISGLNTTCTLISNILGIQTPTVPVLFQTLFTASCSLQSQINNLTAIVTAGYSYNVQCLTGITSNSTTGQVIQAVINKACSNDTRITVIENDYVKASELCTLVQACINPPDGGGGSTPTQFNARMVPYAPIPYVGSLANFDNTGKGLVAAGFDKIYLMNGLNGTQDWRGRSPIGAIQNVPGGVLDSAVDPFLPQNVGTNYVLNQKVGASSVALTLSQIPNHTHPLTDPGHKHSYVQVNGNSYTGGTSDVNGSGANSPMNTTKNTNTANTGITIGYAGGGLAHTNLQPSAGCYYIIYIP